MSSWTVYIVECSDRTLYTGIAKDVSARVAKHNKGSGAKYTRSRRPVKILKTWAVEGVSEALKLEAKIKKLSRAEKLRL